jgi:hypothetical protein
MTDSKTGRLAINLVLLGQKLITHRGGAAIEMPGRRTDLHMDKLTTLMFARQTLLA